MKEKKKKETNELVSGLNEVLETHDQKKLLQLDQKYHPVDFAEVLNDFPEKHEVLKIIELAPDDLKSEIFVHLDVDLQEYIIRKLPNTTLKPLVKDLYSDDLVDIIDEMSTKNVEKILKVASAQKRQELNHILRNDEESAGGNMSTEFIKFRENTTIAQARKTIYQNHRQFESVDDIYVLDEYGILLGEVKLKDLVINESHKRLKTIMETNFISVNEKADQEQIIELFKKYDVNVLPVVDDENHMIGILNSEDVIDVMEEEQTEDIQKLAGIRPLGDEFFKVSPWKVFLSRIGWLGIGLLISTVAQILIVVFLNAYNVNGLVNDYSSKAFAAVYLLLPVAIVIANVVGIGANQTTSQFVRIIALNRYDKKEIWQMVGKEFLVTTLSILSLIVFNLVRLLAFYGVQFKSVSESYLWYAILTTSLTIIITMLLATTMGVALPILMKRFKKDPMAISAPLTTSMIDVVSIALLFGLGLAFY